MHVYILDELRIAAAPEPAQLPGVEHPGRAYGNFAVDGMRATSNTFTDGPNGGYEGDPYLNLNKSGATNLSLGQDDVRHREETNRYDASFGGLGAAQVTRFAVGTNQVAR